MAKFRLDNLATLARQMRFTPHQTRQTQLAGAEQLLHAIEANKTYPLDYIVFKITGYHPKVDSRDLLTGLALQHDLGLLIEQVSQGLDLQVQDQPEPVLTIEDVAQRFNVTSKTIQRWRRRGLPARRFIFPDAKRRVGFLLGSVERFLAAHEDQTADANCSEVSRGERQEILRRARRLAVQGQCWEAEIARRIAGRLHRSSLTILHTIRKHDQENPVEAIFAQASSPVADQPRQLILKGYRQGRSLAALAARVGRPRWAVYRVLLDSRIQRLKARKVRFIDDPLYHQADAEAAVRMIAAQSAEIACEPAAREQMRMPRDLPPYLQELYRVPLLSAAQERGLFLRLNYHKFQFVMARRRLDVEFARARDLQVLERELRQATEVKNAIVRANLRLVVSVARKHLRPGLNLMELVSEGNLTLMRAVEGFDIHKGNRFSTYATLALMKGFARSVPTMLSWRQGVAVDEQVLAAVPDPRTAVADARLVDQEHLETLLARLDERERRILRGHYGLGDRFAVPATYEQMGQRLGLSKQRVRQIEQLALAKLRQAAGVC